MSTASTEVRRFPTPEEREARNGPPLHVVRRRRSRTRVVSSMAVAAIFTLLFVVAGLQAVLVQGQLELDAQARELEELEEQRDRLAIEVTTLEAPARIEETARDLGLVRPPEVVYVEPPSPGSSPSTVVPAATPGEDDAGAPPGGQLAEADR